MCRRHPEVLWAQRSDKVYLTIALPDAKDVSVKCEGGGLFSFSAVGVQGESFDFSLELFGNIVPEVFIYLFYFISLCIFTLLALSCEIFCGFLSFYGKDNSCVVDGLQSFCFIGRRMLMMGSF